MNAARPPGNQQALYIVEQALHPAAYDLPDNFLSFERFTDVLTTLTRDSTPGLPYCREKPTIGEWLGWDGIKYDAIAVQRLWYDVKLVLDGKWDHLMKCFIKMEPHKRSKIDLKRWRLIICYSLPVQVAWKMIFDYGNKKFIDVAYEIPCQQGVVLPFGNWKLFYQQWRSRGYNAGTDASAWDWTVSGWMLEDALEIRRRLTRGTENTRANWYTIARRLYSEAFDAGAKIVLPSGVVLRQEFNGLQKSGSPNTIADNSLIRFYTSVLASMHAGLPLTLGRFLGDDALEKLPEEESKVEALKRAYASMGIVIKSVERGMEFAGHRFDREGPKPLYLSKHLWKLVYTPTELLPEYVDSMARLYCHSPKFELWEDIARLLGVRLYSKEYYLGWYDLPEYDVT